MLNLILTTRRSSHQGTLGSGLGLLLALEAMREIRAFVSLRTGTFWMYRSFNTGEGEPCGVDLLHTADSGELADIRGATFNILFPLALQSSQ